MNVGTELNPGTKTKKPSTQTQPNKQKKKSSEKLGKPK